MRGKGMGEGLRLVWVAGLVLMASTASGAAPLNQKGVATGVCRVGVIEGEVKAGESFARPIGGGLEVRLEALSWGSGWLLRVLPVKGGIAKHDYAELATPPYESVSPLLLSTDFSFRAQDAVAWNPRRFRYADNSAEFGQLVEIYGRYRESTPPSVKTENELAAAASKAPEGTLQILDARLIPGSANQAGTAATVATHFNSSAHTVEEPPEGKGTPLGKVTWVRFRVSLDLRPGFQPDKGLKIESHPCN
jgi:hypothetical protein